MTWIARLADRAAALVRRSPRTSRSRAWGATPVDRFAFQRGTTTSWGCAERRACRAAPGSCRCRARRTSAGRWRGPFPISQSCSTRRSGRTRLTRKRAGQPSTRAMLRRAVVSRGSLAPRAQGRADWCGTWPVWNGARRSGSHNHRQSRARSAEERGRRRERRGRSRPGRSAARQLDDHVRLQVRPHGVPGKSRSPARALAG